MQTLYVGNTLINDVMLGSQRMDDVFSNPNYNIGDLAYGGVIIYITGSFPDQSGIVVATQDAYSNVIGPPFPIWGCSGTSISTSTAVGTGQANTNAILAGCATRPILASIADDYTEGGYSDWYLPSEGELDLINTYYNLIPNIYTGPQAYASSTQTNSTQFRAKFITSVTINRAKDASTSSIRVRTCRSFTTS
jgi:hypothetical protein